MAYNPDNQQRRKLFNIFMGRLSKSDIQLAASGDTEMCAKIQTARTTINTLTEEQSRVINDIIDTFSFSVQMERRGLLGGLLTRDF
jgi:hypothetical protein